MKKLNLQTIVWKEGNVWISRCINVEVGSFGKTKKEAIEKLHEALELYFEDESVTAIGKVKEPDLVSLQIEYA